MLYEKKCILDLPLSVARHDASGKKTKDRSFLRAHVLLGDGISMGIPRKLLGSGYFFDGVEDFLSGIEKPSGNFTVSIVKRISGVISVTHENNLTGLNEILTPGGFSGELLNMRIHSVILTANEKLHEEYILLNRINFNDLPTGFLSHCIADGSCVLYHDYRGGSFWDLSKFLNHGSPHEDLEWFSDGLNFATWGWASVIVDPDVSLESEDGTIIAMADFSLSGFSVPIMTKQSGGVKQYNLNCNGNFFELEDSTATRTIGVVDITKVGVFGVSWESGQLAVGYGNGEKIGDFSGTTTIVPRNIHTFIGRDPIFGGLFPDKLKAILIFNRPLTDDEHARLYEELTSDFWTQNTYKKHKIDLQDDVDVYDASLVAAYSDVKINKFYNIKENKNNCYVNGQHSVYGDLRSQKNTDGGSVDTGIKLNPVLSSYTMSAWVKINSAPAINTGTSLMGVGSGGSAHLYPYSGGVSLINIGDELSFYYSQYNGSSYDHIYTPLVTIDAVINKWFLVGYVNDVVEGKVNFYVNGFLVGFLEDKNIIDTGKNIRFFGVDSSHANLSDAVNVEFAVVQIFNQAKDDSFFEKELLKGEKAFWEIEFSGQESIINETSGFLSNSLFNIRTGEFKIESDIINGKRSKIIDCKVAGMVAMDITGIEEA